MSKSIKLAREIVSHVANEEFLESENKFEELFANLANSRLKTMRMEVAHKKFNSKAE